MKVEEILTEDANMEQKITNIARKVLGIASLQSKNSDRDDFHDIHCERLADALRAAYVDGLQTGQKLGFADGQLPANKDSTI